MKLIETIKNKLGFTKLSNKYNLLKVKNERNKEIREHLSYILDNSYIDKDSNTLVLKMNTNLIVSTEGSQLFVSHDGTIVNLAPVIHLNPILSPESKMTINRLKNNNIDEVLVTMGNALIKGD